MDDRHDVEREVVKGCTGSSETITGTIRSKHPQSAHAETSIHMPNNIIDSTTASLNSPYSR